MTAQEAIIILDGFNLRNNADKYDIEALNIAQDALEKQIPKPVGFERIKEDVCTCTNQIAKAGTSLFKCPACDEYIECRTYKFCNCCGQALDWSE